MLNNHRGTQETRSPPQQTGTALAGVLPEFIDSIVKFLQVLRRLRHSERREDEALNSMNDWVMKGYDTAFNHG